MARRIRVHELDGLTTAVGLVCEPAGGADDGRPAGAVGVEPTVLNELLSALAPDVDVLVFVTDEDAGLHDAAATARIVRLVEGLRNAPLHVAAIRRVRAVNAAKRVHDGVVVEAVDRETLNLLRPPEVVDRHALETALERLGGSSADDVVNPTVLVASDGGTVLVVEDDDVDPGAGSTGSVNGSS